MSVLAYHPETGASVQVADEALVHMRRSGWVTKAEWDAMQAPPEEAAEAAPAAEATVTAKSAKSEGK